MKSARKPLSRVLAVLARPNTWIIVSSLLGIMAAVVWLLFDRPEVAPITSENWNPYEPADSKSSITHKPVLDSDRALEVSFNLEEEGYVAIYKKLTPQVLEETQGIRFVYSGTGAPNTLELRLIDKYETMFEVVWQNSTATGGQDEVKQVLYNDFRCRKAVPTEDEEEPPGNCHTDEDVRTLVFNPEDIDRIDFTFSNKPEVGDIAGQGTVVIKEVWVIQ